MKNSILILLVMIGFISWVSAQDYDYLTLDAKRIAKGETPQAVVDAIKKDFPNLNVIDYYLYPGDKINSHWAVTVDDELKPNEQIDHYTVMLKGKKGGYVYGLYDKNGKLEKMKMQAVDFTPPQSIATAATTGEYQGYSIKSDKFVKVVNKKNEKEYFEVNVTNGHDNKTLVFTPEGNLIKEK